MVKRNWRLAGKRIVGFILALLLAASVPLGSAAEVVAQSRVPMALPATRIDATNLPEGDWVYFGTAAASLDEANQYYTIPIYREGDLTQNASVTLHTIDMTALYGQDYTLEMPGVTVSEQSQSILESYLKQAREMESSAQETVSNEMTSAAEVESASFDSKLAQLKESSTGESTRDLSETQAQDIVQGVAEQMIPQVMSDLEHSGAVTLTFEPGEDEKWITFRLIDDSRSEGTESFTILLADAEGAEPYSVTSFSATINDDEPLVHSTVSFTKTRYDSVNGIATVTVRRSGAEHSLVDMRIFTSEDTAKAGVNYDAMDAILTFLPYETEKDVDFYVGGEGSFSVLLSDFTACQAGQYTKTKVYLSPDSAGTMLLASSDTTSFSITIDGKNYTVEYVKGESTGKIMDYGYEPALEVGRYYFALPTSSGGIFNYDIAQRTGSKPYGCGTLDCEYVTKDNQHESYGDIAYYHTYNLRKGSVYTQTDAVIPGVYFQYIVPDWESTKDVHGGQEFHFYSETLGLDAQYNGKFSRTQSHGQIVLKNIESVGTNRLIDLRASANDSNKHRTPKSYLRFYGAAAMYKSYNISVNEPAKMSFLTGTGASIAVVPVQVSVRCGAQTWGSGNSRFIYANPETKQSNLVFSLDTANVNGAEDKFGVVTGYTITVRPLDDEKAVILNYPEGFISYLETNKNAVGRSADYKADTIDKKIEHIKQNMDTIAYDAYFIDWIDFSQKDVVNSSLGYYQNLIFTPKLEYVDVAVEVRLPYLSNVQASFDDAALSKIGTYTYHAGDVLDLSATCTTDGYYVQGYEYSTDGGKTWDIITRTQSLQLLPKYTKYVIRPVVVESDNCIQIKYDGTATNILGVNNQGLVSNDLLSQEGLGGRIILNLNPKEQTAEAQMNPEVGKVYSICFQSYTQNGKTYIPVITDASGKTYTTQRFDFVAGQRAGDNVLTLTYEEMKDVRTYQISGRLVSNYAPILATGTKTHKLGVSGYTVSLAREQKTTVDPLTQTSYIVIDSATAQTASDGSFTLTDIRGAEGDRLTLLVSNGADTQVLEVVLGSKAELDIGELDLTYPSKAPYVASLMYYYDKDTNNVEMDNSDNSVRIFDDAINITIVVNDMDCAVNAAQFTAYTVGFTGEETSETTYTVYADPTKPGVYTLKIPKMTENLYNGQRIRVSLVNLIRGTVDPETGILGEDTILSVYPAVETGMVFYVENALLVPQTYETGETPTVDIPILGASNASTGTGLLTWSRTDWEDGLGYSITVNFNELAWNTTTNGMKDLRQEVDDFTSTVHSYNHAKWEADMHSDGKKSSQELLKQMMGGQTLFAGDVPSEVKMQADFLKTAKQAKESLTGFNHASKLQVQVASLLAFNFILNPETNEYVFAQGAVSIGGTINYSKTWYTIVYGVPLYLNLSGFLQLDLTAYYATPAGQKALTAGQFDSYAGNVAELLSEQVEFWHTMSGSIKASVGVGMCGVLGGGGALSFQLQYSIPLSEDISDDYGVLIIGEGGLFVDLLIMRLDIPLAKVTLGFGTYENKSSVSFIGDVFSSSILQSAGEGEASTDVSTQNYGAGTTDMSLFGGNGMIQATPEEVQRTVLLSNAAERTAPQIIKLDDGRKMIFFMGNRGNQSALNSRALFWSVYENGNWSVPQIVSDDGTADASPAVLQKNGKVVVAWVDADRAYTESDTTIDKLNALGISLAIYENGSMSQELTLVEDEFFNCAPQLNLVDDTLYCSYMKRDISSIKDDHELLDMTKTYSTMASVECDISSRTVEQEHFVVIKHPVLTDPLVMDYHCVTAEVGDEDYMLATYTVDEDTNLRTTADRELFLSITNLTTGQSYYPIALTSDQVDQAAPKLSNMDGTVYLTWFEHGYLFNLMNVSELLEAFFHAEQVGDTYRNDTGKDWYRKSANELPGILPGNGDEDAYYYDGSFYDLAAQGIFRYEQTNFQASENENTSISDYVLTTNGDDLYIFYTDFGSSDTRDLGVELYGVRYERDVNGDDTDEDWGFGKGVMITDYGKVIDEFDLYMTQDNKISVVSNHYAQWIDGNGNLQRGTNELVEIEFEPASSLSIVNDRIVLPNNLVGGTTDLIAFNVMNDGLLDATGFDVSVFEVKDGKETPVYDGTYEVELESGEEYEVQIPWTIPENLADTEIKVVVTERDVAISRPTEATMKVPYCSDLEFSGTAAKWDGEEFYLTTTITNTGNADAPASTARVAIAEENETGKIYATVDVPAMASGESVELKIPFVPAVEDFSELGIINLVLQVVSGEEVIGDIYSNLTVGRPALAEVNEGAESLTLRSGDSASLSTAVAPWDGIAGEAVFSSNDPTVADVDQDGVVHGVAAGTAIITVYYPACGVSDTIEVIVADGSSPGTGDNMNAMMPVLLMIPIAGLVVCLVKKRRFIG